LLDDVWTYMTLNETIELMLEMQGDGNQKSQLGYPTGLYIEPKAYQWYMETYNVDILKITHDHLIAYGIDTIAKSEKKIPVIMEAFEPAAMRKYATMTDLPIV
jgi:hypothetical protein